MSLKTSSLRQDRKPGLRWGFGVIVVLTACLSGCAADLPPNGQSPQLPPNGSVDVPTPTPSPTETALPTITRTDDVAPDPRCVREFPDHARVLAEAELEGRPDLWPAVPDFAVLCWTEWENEYTQVAWYATDSGVGSAAVYRHYERALLNIGVTGRARTDQGEILTGVVPPQHSFWMLAPRDHYRVTWSFDGEYAD